MTSTSQMHRTPAGGLIDRNESLRFSFDGIGYRGHPGDTLASALLANGVRLIGRSFKYHRPRGVFSAGSEEPSALVTLQSGARAEPNTRATMAELYAGLEAGAQNCWPARAFDLMAVNDLAAPLLTAGFYYKTFMWPASFWEKLYEPLIRRAAGLGRLSGAPDPDAYDRGYLCCDLLIIGAGPAGLAAALAAGRAGARVLLVDEDFRAGGRLLAERGLLQDMGGAEWVAGVLDELHTLPNVRVMARATVVGAFDGGIYGVLERVADHLPTPAAHAPRQTFWRVRAARALLCAGAGERGIAFPGNDRPGVMLAGALRAYANRWGVLAGRRVALFVNNDDALRGVADLVAAGADVVAVIDVRDGALPQGVRHFPGGQVVATHGRLGLRAITVRDAAGRLHKIGCDALGVSGGWNPAVHLTCHQRGRPEWDEALAAFVPGALPPGMIVAGAARGEFSTHAALNSGAAAAAAICADLGLSAHADLPLAEDAPVSITPFWAVQAKGRAFVDLQNDVTVKDIAQAHRENYRSVEHMKRYTTLGMATDQGRTSNVLGLAVLAELTGQGVAAAGTTTYRPPYSPVAIGALAGRARGVDFRPTRLTPTHDWAEGAGAVFTDAGAWKRAAYFPRGAETHWRETVDREVLAVRAGVGLCDVSSLGKIDIQGRDAGEFINRVYCNGMATLAVGRVRYGLMLREDGFVMDDGTCARLGEGHYLMTTTTANAVSVFRHLEFCRQCLWPDLDVRLMSVTEAWAQISLAGPRARDLLAWVVAGDMSDAALPFMACGAVIVAGVPGRVFRISFSGELAFELAVPARYGGALMAQLLELGSDLGVVPYGTEALGVLRIEKGHPAGAELNGQTSAHMLGMGRMVSGKKDSIGAVLAQRPALAAQDGLRLVGLLPLRAEAPKLSAGAHLLAQGAAAVLENDQGWVSSAVFSPHVGRQIGLGFLQNGAARMDEVVRAVDPLARTEVECRVVSHHFIDPDGGRLRG
jgi:sarcosine oxidase subunit alpha